jgi:subfamily B ATP-binding cassette protein HlyB/CyaB
MQQYKKMWYIYVFAAVFAAFITQLTIFSNQILIDNILPAYDVSLVILFAVGYGLFKIFNLIITVYKNFISIQLANIFDNYFLSTFIKKLNSFPIRFIHSFNRGDLTERMKDSLMLKTFFLKFFTHVLTDTILSIYSIIILFIIDWKISMLILGIMGVFLLWFKIITPRIRENEKRRFLQKSGLFSKLFENIDGLQVIKSFRLEHLFRQRIQPAIAGMLKIQKRVRYINLINVSIIDFIIIIAIILIIFFLSVNAINYQSVTVGQIITFIALSDRIFSSLSNILEENLDLQENQIILKRYFDFDTANAVHQNEHNKIKNFRIDSIEFKNVCFEYTPHKPVLKNLDFSIIGNEKIKIEGSNGVGKSTFCKVLSMLYPPSSGEIFINNEPMPFFHDSALRKKILLISNDDLLFNDTLGFNITFRNEYNTAHLLELSRQIGFYDFTSNNEDGFDFIITEQGRNLSTGQRKKLLLMRALVSEAELIIVDEVLSGIDAASKEKIEDLINKEKERAFIIISHEPVDNIRFDKILNFSNGNLE